MSDLGTKLCLERTIKATDEAKARLSDRLLDMFSGDVLCFMKIEVPRNAGDNCCMANGCRQLVLATIMWVKTRTPEDQGSLILSNLTGRVMAELKRLKATCQTGGRWETVNIPVLVNHRMAMGTRSRVVRRRSPSTMAGKSDLLKQANHKVCHLMLRWVMSLQLDSCGQEANRNQMPCYGESPTFQALLPTPPISNRHRSGREYQALENLQRRN